MADHQGVSRMSIANILIGQVTDLFRIGLIAGLIYTMLRTVTVTGRLVPLLAGIVFVAAILPLTMGAPPGVPLWEAIALGVVSNALLLAIGLLILRLLPFGKG
jgi:hypothetical protein